MSAQINNSLSTLLNGDQLTLDCHLTTSSIIDFMRINRQNGVAVAINGFDWYLFSFYLAVPGQMWCK
jgi:hypothetical protein